ncbi:MAG: hypothetical protein ABR910_14495 [Acidobacteriaceae bacterium]|jgi:hypothetical protein
MPHHPPDRRHFLKQSSIALALASAGLPPHASAQTAPTPTPTPTPLPTPVQISTQPPAPPKPLPFEVTASLYPWDLHDEGTEHVLDNLQSMASVNSVYLVALMHHEKRPLTSPTFPHNPVRQTWTAEDSRSYWHPHLALYGAIKPQLSDFPWISDTDWLANLTEAARKRRLKTGAELSHTLVNQDLLTSQFSQCVQRDIHGQPHSIVGGAFHLCPNNPTAMEYTLALYRDLVSNYDIDFVQTCTIPLMRGGVESGGCFCDSCMAAAQAQQVDLKKIQAALLANPNSSPDYQAWQRFRFDTMTRYYTAIHSHVHSVRPAIEFRLNHDFRACSDWGLNLRALRPAIDSIRVCDYTEQKGDPALMQDKDEWLAETRAALGTAFPMLSAIAVRPKATPALIHRGVQIALFHQAAGLSLGHYDGAEFPMLRAIKEQLTASKIEVPPTLAPLPTLTPPPAQHP